MTQNQNEYLSAAGVDLRNPGHVRATLASLIQIAALLLGSGLLHGQITNVSKSPPVTATQALISYTAPDSGVCSVEVREGDLQGPLVHDVDPALFPGSNLDSRTANVVNGRKRVFVAGKRAAEPGLDGLRYSRALQAFTAHAFKITCASGTAVATGQFTTSNPPLGASFNDPLPVDPNQPGQYAWPSVVWSNRNQWVVDPFTGFQVKQFDTPRDTVDFPGSGNFVSASNVTGSSDWASPSAVTADDSSAATYSGSTQGWMFLELGLAFLNSATHSAQTTSANSFVPSFNAWCSSPDCATASADDRSIQFCLTVNGTTCASDMLPAVLSACSSNCGGAGNRFAAITNPQTILADWFASNNGNPSIDVTNLSKRSGSVNRNGASVSLVSGDRFDLLWSAGATITINSVVYTIASVDSDGTLTLSGSPAGTDAFAPYSASNAGLLIRKKTASGHQISIQYASYVYEVGIPSTLESTGDEDSFGNCSPAQVAGPNGEMGWHCQISGILYWIGQDSGTVNRLGRDIPPYNPAPDGWNQQACAGGAFWDWNDGNSLYCPTISGNGHLYILKFSYNGGNVDIGDVTAVQFLTVCGTAPCWTLTNLTPGNQALDLQIAAFHPEWTRAKFHTNLISIFGRMGSTNSLTFLVRRDQRNDTLAFVVRYDLNNQRIAGAVPSWHYWPLRWSPSHGPVNLNDPTWILVSSTFFRGPFTGLDFTAGNGPYYSTITSGGISAAGQTCPARPADSPIPGSDWPSGNRCVTVTVDGEPGDPTPGIYSDGTISVSGTAVTGTNVFWSPYMDGSKMLIGNTLYTFTYQAFNQGTLDSSPGTITNSPYTLYLEAINNPQVGNPNFGYLQDAEVRDIFCVTNQVQCITNYPNNEFMRLLVKNGTTWTLQRGYAGLFPQQTTFPLNPNAWLIAFPSSCDFGVFYPCAEGSVRWNALADPYGFNASGTTVVRDTADQGCCHSTRQNGVNVDLSLNCANRDGDASGCYFARFNSLPAAFTDPGYIVTSNPLFHGLSGVGSPNSVDTHPSHQQTPPPANAVEATWIGDERPFLGDGQFGSASTPGTLVGGTLYRFAASQAQRLRPRILPTMAACGANVLLDVSGPSTLLSTGPSDNYKYCIVNKAGECARESFPGDIYVNCPQTKSPYCVPQGVGASDPDTRDICLLDMGSYAINATQVGVSKPDPDGARGRRVTTGFSRYHWMNPFWNVKILPNGRWMLVWSVFLQGQRNSVLLVKLPPFPNTDSINRRDYSPYNVTVSAPQLAGVTNAVVQFGYDKNYFCTSRREACVQGQVSDPALVPFNYQSENPAGIPCANGCTIPVHAIPQRVLYYQVVLRDANNAVVGTMNPEVALIQ